MRVLATAITASAMCFAVSCSEPAEQTAASDDAPAVEQEEPAAPAGEAAGGGDLDEATVAAAKACHDMVWSEDERFKDLPNAAVSIVEDSLTDDDPAIGWEVEWDDPAVSASGTCSMDGETMVVTDAS